MHGIRLATALLALSVLSSVIRPALHAQRESSAYKTAEISAFGGYLNLDPDHGPYRDNGATVGVDYTRYFPFPIAPSLEIRASSASGSAANEKTYLVGLRGEGLLRSRYHPYGDFLIGKGTIHYQPGFLAEGFILGDDSLVYNYGGGVDIDVARNWQAKLDVQGQRWRTGETTYYHPLALMVGIVYRIPFRRYNSQHSLR